MSKTVFLHVKGDDYSALNFEDNFNEDQVYKQMMAEGVTTKTFESDDYYIDVRIIEFGEIDSDFIDFVKYQLIDYDNSKNENIYRVF
jgi:hypothetical protein